MLAQKAAALAQQHGVTHCRFHLIQPRSGQGQQVDVNPHEGFADNVQPAFGQQVVNIRHPAIGRVLDRQHRKIGFAFAHSLDRIFKGAARKRLKVGARLAASLMRIGAGFPLKGDTAGFVGGHR